MAKALKSFRISDEQIEWLDKTSAEFGVTKAALLDDALALARRTHAAANANYGSMMRELAERFGEDAELLTYIDEEGRAQIRVNGVESDDLRANVTIDAGRGVAHVFLEYVPWSRVHYGSEYFGPGGQMIATLPIRSAVSLPYPPDPVHKTAALATIGEILHGAAQQQQELAQI